MTENSLDSPGDKILSKIGDTMYTTAPDNDISVMSKSEVPTFFTIIFCVSDSPIALILPKSILIRETSMSGNVSSVPVSSSITGSSIMGSSTSSIGTDSSVSDSGNAVSVVISSLCEVLSLMSESL